MYSLHTGLLSSVIGCALCITYQEILKSMFLRFKLQTYFESLVWFNICCILKIFVVGRSELSWAQTGIKLCHMLRVNCSLLDNVYWTAVSPFQTIFPIRLWDLMIISKFAVQQQLILILCLLKNLLNRLRLLKCFFKLNYEFSANICIHRIAERGIIPNYISFKFWSGLSALFRVFIVNFSL